MKTTENILKFVKKKKKKTLKINRWVIFHSIHQLQSPFLKIGLCELFPVLLECITYMDAIKQNES